MIKIEPVNNDQDHLIIRVDKPSRLEVIQTNEGQLIVFGYEGTEDNTEQEPSVCYDTLEG